ncbi:MAG TPA: AAA family ATPase [Gemmatimonadales bacterium]|nr:AAA family ATPase [Gemmatimonadales bacterium]
MISLRLLGPVELTVDGGAPPAELLWKKNLALLVYLALSPRQTRTREHLTGLLWGDKPESAARHSLNEALRVLRKAVGDAALVTDATSVKLEAGTVSMDLNDFARHEVAHEWRQAGALVGGAPLEGFAVPGESAFEDWLTAERSQWERRSVAALAQAAEQSLSKGNTTDGVALAERAMSMAPTSNQAAAVLLKALALSGSRAAALARYEDYAQALRERLGVEPEAALSALADRIRKDRLGPAPESEAAKVAQTRRLPLFGREEALAALTGAWRRAVSGKQTAVAVVLADAGLGKTRLVEELMARVGLEGGVTLRVRCVETDKSSPWSGLLGAARGGLLEARGIASAPASAHAAFAAQITEWGDRYRGAGGTEPAPLPRAFTELVRAAADEQPVLVVTDDCHYLDVESFQSLAALPRDVPAAPIMLLLTAEPAVPSDTLDALRSRFGRDLPGEVVELGPLTNDALMAMARAVFPNYAASQLDRLTRRVAADSAGVPLLAIEILHGVSSGLDWERESGAWPAPYHTLTQTSPGDLPDSIIAAVRIGYRRLSDAAQRTLAAAAALGGRVTAARLARATGIPAAQVDAALDELEWQRWLVADGRGYAFVAGIVERIIERDMLTTGQRRRMKDA